MAFLGRNAEQKYKQRNDEIIYTDDSDNISKSIRPESKDLYRK